MQAYVHESAECGNVGDNAREFHPGTEVVNRMDIVGESEFRNRLARIQSRLGKFLDDVVQGRQSDIGSDIAGRIYFRA